MIVFINKGQSVRRGKHTFDLNALFLHTYFHWRVISGKLPSGLPSKIFWIAACFSCHSYQVYVRRSATESISSNSRNISKETYHSSASRQSGWNSTLKWYQHLNWDESSSLRSISRRILTSSLVTKLIATPLRPNRPLRPIRWMYCSTSQGMS